MVIPTLAIALAACAVDAPTTPRARVPANLAQSLAVSGESLQALRGTVSDAQVRLLPALGDDQAQSRLASALNGVDAALAAEDAGALADSLGAARTVLAAEIEALGADSPVAADLDALALTLDAVEHALPADMQSL
ncbi:MAG TPA: hypothetical protein VFQ76_18910 [Longimicrobiaceae bacterium]|nr:hypothetical protein [Longimicrobiaceae bacterium]